MILRRRRGVAGVVLLAAIVGGATRSGASAPSAATTAADTVVLELRDTVIEVGSSVRPRITVRRGGATVTRPVLRVTSADTTRLITNQTGDTVTFRAVRRGIVPVTIRHVGRDGELVTRTWPIRIVARNIAMLTPEVELNALGDSLALGLELRDARGVLLPSSGVAWTTRNPRVALVNGRGVVVATGPGVTEVTAKVDGRAVSASVLVQQLASALVFTPAEIVLDGAGARARAFVSARDGRGLPIAEADALTDWRSRTPAIAEVTSDGRMVARAPGTTWVYAETAGLLDSVRVRVLAGRDDGPAIADAAVDPMPPDRPTIMRSARGGDDEALEAALREERRLRALREAATRDSLTRLRAALLADADAAPAAGGGVKADSVVTDSVVARPSGRVPSVSPPSTPAATSVAEPKRPSAPTAAAPVATAGAAQVMPRVVVRAEPSPPAPLTPPVSVRPALPPELELRSPLVRTVPTGWRSFSLSAIGGYAEHGVDLSGGPARSSGVVSGGAISITPRRWLDLRGQVLVGTLNADTAIAESRDMGEAEGTVSLRVLSWLSLQASGRVRTFSNELGAQRWTTLMTGAEARYGFIGGRIHGVVRGALMPVATVSGLPDPNRALAVSTGMEFSSGVLTLGLVYGVDRFRFTLDDGTERREQLGGLRTSIRLGR